MAFWKDMIDFAAYFFGGFFSWLFSGWLIILLLVLVVFFGNAVSIESRNRDLREYIEEDSTEVQFKIMRYVVDEAKNIMPSCLNSTYRTEAYWIGRRESKNSWGEYYQHSTPFFTYIFLQDFERVMFHGACHNQSQALRDKVVKLKAAAWELGELLSQLNDPPFFYLNAREIETTYHHLWIRLVRLKGQNVP
jgi:hypothetical protein